MPRTARRRKPLVPAAETITDIQDVRYTIVEDREHAGEEYLPWAVVGQEGGTWMRGSTFCDVALYVLAMSHGNFTLMSREPFFVLPDGLTIEV